MQSLDFENESKKSGNIIYSVAIRASTKESEQNGLVIADSTKVLTVEEYDKFLLVNTGSKRVIFEI
jgi:hypothetical protein